MSRPCDNCGAEVPEGARFCDNCGMPVSDSEAAPPQEAPPREAPTQQASTPSPSTSVGRSGFDLSPPREAPSQEAPAQQAPASPPLSSPPQPSSPSLPPPSQPTSPPLPPPPPVEQPPISVPPPPAAREDDQPLWRRHRVPILSLLLLLLVLLLGGTAYALIGETNEDVATAAVPNLVGASSVEEAQRMAGGNFEVVEGNGVESRQPIGAVARQDPAPGRMADEGSTISVDVSKGVKLPDAMGETREEAVRILERVGFEVEEETEESSAGNKGYVIEQDPRGGEGETTEAGSTVAITVGEGPANPTPKKVKSPAPKQTPVPPPTEKKVEEPEPKPPPPPVDKKIVEPDPAPSLPPINEEGEGSVGPVGEEKPDDGEKPDGGGKTKVKTKGKEKKNL